MDIEKYKFFLKVVELGNLTKAAESMGYSQSGASHIIKTMENELGIRLLIRGHFGIRVASEAEPLLPAIRNLIANEEKIRDISNSIAGLESGTLRIGAFVSICLSWLPAVAGRFHTLYPNIKLEILSGSGSYENMEQLLQEGFVDISFVRAPVINHFEVTPLANDPLHLVLPPNHPLVHVPEPIPYSMLSGHPMLMPTEGNNDDITRLFVQHNFVPTIALTMQDDLSLLALAENGLGYTILPGLIVNARPHHAILRRLEDDPFRALGIASRFGEERSLHATAFIRILQEYISSQKEHST